MPSSALRPAASLLLLALLSACVLLTSATSAPTAVTLVHTNSSALSFTVELPADNDATTLHVLVRPERDANATDLEFDLIASPMLVEMTNLRPNAQYTLSFSLKAPGNESDVLTLDTLRTHSLGPQIIGFYASDPSPSDAAADALFSAGDQVTLIFDLPTNQPGPLNSPDEVEKFITFSQPLGSSYSGSWSDDKTLVITISDIGQTSTTAGLGSLRATVVGELFNPDGTSDMSRSVSPPLIGSWAAVTDATPLYFKPTTLIPDPMKTDALKTGDVVNSPSILSYNFVTLVNQEIPFPLRLQYPDNAPKGVSYALIASIVYPTLQQTNGFSMMGDNSTGAGSGPVMGTNGKPLTNAKLQQVLETYVLRPPPGYEGYVSLQVGLYTQSVRGLSQSPVSQVFLTFRVDPTPRPDIPQLTVAKAPESSLLSNPISVIKDHQTGLIIGLCVVFGFFLLLGVGICAYRKYKGRHDAAEFEGDSLKSSVGDDEQVGGGEGGPTRRFYYDAKV